MNGQSRSPETEGNKVNEEDNPFVSFVPFCSEDSPTVAIASLPETDERVVYAKNCLATVNEKRTANAPAESGVAEPE